MTLRQTIVWTALPNGITGVPSDRRPQLSVLVSPQLQSDGAQDRLSGDFADWPARLNSGQLDFAVTAAGLSTPATRVSPPPDSGLWRALFGGCVVGDPPAPEQLADSRVYSSYPVAGVHRRGARSGLRRARPPKARSHPLALHRGSGGSVLQGEESSGSSLAGPEGLTQ